MPVETFNNLHPLPDPVPGTDEHYSTFEKIYGTQTTEQHRPSLEARKGRQKSLPFSASVQHVKNVGIMVQCEECQMWRLLYSKKKLQASERQALQQALDDVTYTCGAQLQDLELPGSLAGVYARDIRCHDPTEKLYYSVRTYPPICVYCASEESLLLPSVSRVL